MIETGIRSLARATRQRVLSPSVLLRIRRYIQALGRQVHSGSMHRKWSNDQLAAVGPLFSGDIVNVSGWRDEDRGNPPRRYRDYFPSRGTYTITNYPGARGLDDADVTDLALDLEQPLPKELCGRFDVVLCHTVLEHVLDVERAFDAIAGLTRDVAIIVVPFLQEQHYDAGSYGDYWRFTPMALDGMLRRRGLTTVYSTANDQPWYPIYLFHIASRNPDRWRELMPAVELPPKLATSVFPW